MRKGVKYESNEKRDGMVEVLLTFLQCRFPKASYDLISSVVGRAYKRIRSKQGREEFENTKV